MSTTYKVFSGAYLQTRATFTERQVEAPSERAKVPRRQTVAFVNNRERRRILLRLSEFRCAIYFSTP